MPIVTAQEVDAFQSAMTLQRQRRFPEAEVAFRRVLAFNPNNVEALHMLGVMLYQAGHPKEGVPFIERALALRPGHLDTLINLSEVQRTVGNTAAALAAVDQAIAVSPQSSSAHTNRAAILRQAGRNDEALAAALRAIELDPRQQLAYVHAGCVLISTRPQEALPYFQKATEIEPNNPETLSSLGVCLEILGRHEENLKCQQRALTLAPSNLAIGKNLGSALMNCGRYEDAEGLFRQIVGHDPQDLVATLNFAACQHRLKRYDEVLKIATRAAADHPGTAEPWTLIADAQGILGNFPEALAAIDRGLALSNLARLHHSKGIILVRAGRAPEGLAALHQALSMEPENPILRFAHSVALLVLGRYAEAWPPYEWRWKHPSLRGYAVNFPQPQWDGSPLQGKRILLYAEQGLGDTVFFGRYATKVAEEKGGHVILVVQPQLVELMTSVRGVREVVTTNMPMPRFDTHLPIMSLPGAFHTTLENIPHDVPYVAANPEKVARWKERLSRSRHGFRVGLVWEGGAFQLENFLRSASLEAFSPLAQVPVVSFYSLQKGPAAAQAKSGQLPAAWSAPDADFTDLDADIQDFSDTAAILQNMDLLISIDTSVVHVAGALARPVWMLLAHAPGHMWLLDRTDTPWYPTFRLFRQPAFKDWATPVAEVTRLLRERVRG